MYRLLTETLLGLNLEGNRLLLLPRLPKSWTTCRTHYRYRQTPYDITISRLPQGSPGAGRTLLDGKELAGNSIPLVDDRREHRVEMWLPDTSP
jgi:cellobiose phosphorylase